MGKVLRITKHFLNGQRTHDLQAQRQLTALRRACAQSFNVMGIEVVEIGQSPEAIQWVTALIREHGAQVLEVDSDMPIFSACRDPRNGVQIPVITAVFDRSRTNGRPSNFFSHYEWVRARGSERL